MNRPNLLLPLAIILLFIALIAGCDKERIVESTEIIHDVKYIELPPDTVIIYDTVVSYDSVTIQGTDTLTIIDTVVQTNTVVDTFIQVVTIQDTIIQVNTIYDTVIQVNTIYDTVTTTITLTDTVVQLSNDPDALTAIGIMQYWVNPIVLDFATQEFGLTSGWIYYLSPWQSDITELSTGVYDIFGYIEYWAPDWSGYYSFEYLYRIAYIGGDPSDVNNWVLSEPPAASPNQTPGLKSSTFNKLSTGSLMR